MKKGTKKILIIIVAVILLVIISIGGYNYYKYRYLPKKFITSFLEDLEKYETTSIAYLPYFVDEFYTIDPAVKSWNDFYLEHQKKESALNIEQLFEVWKKVYISRIEPYLPVVPTLFDPEINLYTEKLFLQVYQNVKIINAELEEIDYINKNELHATGYIELIGKGGDSGVRKFDIYARYGDFLGWRVILF